MHNRIITIIFVEVFLFPIIANSQYLRESEFCEARQFTTNLDGDLNNDGIKDSLSIAYGYGQTSDNMVESFLSIKNEDNYTLEFLNKIIITPRDGCESSCHFEIDQGQLIYNECNFEPSTESQYFCKLLPDKKKWYIVSYYKLKNVDFEHDISDESKELKRIFSGPESTFLGDKYPPQKVLIISKKQQNHVFEELKKMYSDCYLEYKTQTNVFVSSIEEEHIENYLESVVIDNATVQLFNDLAFYLIDYNLKHPGEGNTLRGAVAILENVIFRFPKRKVAYINLGDAYWGLDEKEYAKNAYQKYIELMKADGKETKIPQRVFERVK